MIMAPPPLHTHTYTDRSIHHATMHAHTCRGVNLKLSPGTVTSIVGPSGAGKTTLTQILSR